MGFQVLIYLAIGLSCFVIMIYSTIVYIQKLYKYKYSPVNWNLIPSALGTFIPVVSIANYIFSKEYHTMSSSPSSHMFSTYVLLVAPLILASIFITISLRNGIKRTSIGFGICNFFIQAIIGWLAFATAGLILLLVVAGTKKMFDEIS